MVMRSPELLFTVRGSAWGSVVLLTSLRGLAGEDATRVHCCVSSGAAPLLCRHQPSGCSSWAQRLPPSPGRGHEHSLGCPGAGMRGSSGPPLLGNQAASLLPCFAVWHLWHRTRHR